MLLASFLFLTLWRCSSDLQDDPLRMSMSSSLMSPLSQQEISTIDSKVRTSFALSVLGVCCSPLNSFRPPIVHYYLLSLSICQFFFFVSFSNKIALCGQIHETVEQIHLCKTRREFFMQYSKNPQVSVARCTLLSLLKWMWLRPACLCPLLSVGLSAYGTLDSVLLLEHPVVTYFPNSWCLCFCVL